MNVASAEQAEKQEVTTELSLTKRIETATMSNHHDVVKSIAQVKNRIERDVLAGKLAKVLGVNKSIISSELKSTSASEETEYEGEPQMKAVFPGLVDLVLDNNNNIRYLVKGHDGLHLDKTYQDEDGVYFVPPAKKHIHFPLPKAEHVMQHFQDEDQTLYEDLIRYFKRFSYLEDNVWPIIVLSVFLSYMQDHPDVRYLPVIYFYAVAERGKSRTAKTMLSVSYRGLHLLDIRPANIIRFSEHLNATLFFDVTDLWRSAEKSDGQDILLGRFEKGTKVARVLNADKGPFADQTFFDVYGSTIVATNEPANSTFESRCISITMPNKPGEYENLTAEMGLPLKDRLTSWRARMMDKRLPHVDAIYGINGRLWDICRPLFQLSALIAPEAYEPMKRVFLEMSGQKVEDKKDTIEGQIIEAIDEIADFDGDLPTEIPVEDIRKQVNKGKIDRYHISPQKLGKRLQSLGIKTKSVNGYSRAVLTEPALILLLEQYGLLDPLPEETPPLATTPQEPEVQATADGSESVESSSTDDTLPADKVEDIPPVMGMVESGRELQGPGETALRKKPTVRLNF